MTTKLFEKLDAYKHGKSSNLQNLEAVGIDVGCEPKEYYPKLKDSQGRQMKDDGGKDMRSELPAGWTYTFSEYGTAKMVKVVLPEKIETIPLTPYRLSGNGYDIKGSMLFMVENGTLVPFE